MPPKLPSETSLGRVQPIPSRRLLTYTPPLIPNTFAGANLRAPLSSSGKGLSDLGVQLDREAQKIEQATKIHQDKIDVFESNKAISDLQIFQAKSFEEQKTQGDTGYRKKCN